jgi:hypothetical protein
MSRIVVHGTTFDKDYPDNVMTLNTNGDGVTTQNFAMETDTVRHVTPRNIAEYMYSAHLVPASTQSRGLTN